MPITIASNTPVPIEQHFRVSAGPGAGKTHWLIGHINDTLHCSVRLGKHRKVACITYTNVAVETIVSRLSSASDRVEVSTIHSFLYKHFVKPFAFQLAQDYNLDISKIDGHDEAILSNYSFLQEWKTKTGQQRITDDKAIIEALSNSRWRFDGSQLINKPKRPYQADGYSIKNNSYQIYKEMAWERGIIHHDDVLYFSYQIAKRYPFALDLVRAKFPYFFVDEFQDTSPLQTEILKMIGQSETIIGVVGDKAQSIYSFQGAEVSNFDSFNLPSIQDYVIENNRRSSINIVRFLNTIRTDLTQTNLRTYNGAQPTLIIGSMTNAIAKASQLSGDQNVYSLSRINVTSNLMRRHLNNNNFDDSLLDKLQEVDIPSSNNRYRSKVVAACIKGVEIAKQQRFKEAIKAMQDLYPRNMDKDKRQKLCLKHLELLLNNYDSYKNRSLYDFFSVVKSSIQDVSDLRAGRAKTFYEGHTYLQLSVCVKIGDDTSLHRTIHKAKGAEFTSVLLVLERESDLIFVTTPNLGNEEHRINYVAVSRAKDNLFITVPSLSASMEAAVSRILNIERV